MELKLRVSKALIGISFDCSAALLNLFIHFLEPKSESVGFVEKQGIAMSQLLSKPFAEGVNNEENRLVLKQLADRNADRKAGINKALSNLDIPP